MHHRVYKTQEAIKHRRHRRLSGWNGRYYLCADRQARSAVSNRSQMYKKPASIKEHKNE
jgi:hypothetical protein